MPVPEPDRLTTQDAVNVIGLRLSEYADEPEQHGLNPLDACRALALIVEHAEGSLTEAIANAHRRGHTLDTIGKELGISRQAVWNRLDRADLLAPR
jgi:hypothetical protein